MKNSHTAKIFFSIINRDKKYSFQNTKWQALRKLAIGYQLLPVFYISLIKENSVKDISEEFLSGLRNLYLDNLRRNIKLERELYEILKSLGEAGIEAMPLKGPVLARLLYNDLAFRQCSVDLDILIRQDALAMAEARLEESGFCSSHKKDNSGLSRLTDLKYTKQAKFFKTTKEMGPLSLDLHWDVCGYFRDSHLKELWSNAKYVNLNGHKILVSCDEDLVLYLSITAITHYDCVQLKYIYDMHQLVSRFQNRWDWQGLIEKAKEKNLAACLYFALKLSRDLFMTEVPRAVLHKLRPGLIKSNILAIWINKRNFFDQRRAVKLGRSYTWNYLASEYLYSINWPDFLNKVRRRVFAPIEDIAGPGYKSRLFKSYLLYTRRALRPFIGGIKYARVYSEN